MIKEKTANLTNPVRNYKRNGGTLRGKISKEIKKAIRELQKQGNLPKFKIPEILVEHPENEKFGDYATNIAMLLAKIVKKKPMEIANIIKSKCQNPNVKSNPKPKCQKEFKIIERVEVISPGFINFFLAKEFLLQELGKILKQKDKYGSSNIGKGKTVVIDYSSPNIAKPFGIGHLRSTIIGQAIYNIYKFLGWRCIGDNHLGDWGTQFGKLIYQIKKDKVLLKSLTIEKLEKLYIKFHKEAEKTPEIEEEARAWFKKLEQGNKEAKRIWQACVDISLKEFDKIYNLLDIKIDYCLGESFYQKMLAGVVEEAMRKKIAKKSRGTIIIEFPKDILPPAMLLKSDGATTYLTRDLAAIKYRLRRWKPNLIIYEVGTDQTLYFKQLFYIVELLGWARKEKFFHIAHGLVRWKGGKFSTRKGETIHLEQVLEEAVSRARKIIENTVTDRELSKKEKEEIAKMVGIGAVKYNDLSQHHTTDIIFDWDKILNLRGNSGPYLQYTIARCQSVLEKSKFRKRPAKNLITLGPDLKQEEENILRTIYKFPEVVEDSANRFSPNLLCNFAFDLAQKYNSFYNSHPIIKAKTSEKRYLRLALTAATSQVLKNVLKLLGIGVPKRM